MRVRELPRLDLHAEVTTPVGRRYRWAGDEPDAADIPSSPTLDSAIPGGFGQSGCVLARKPGVDYGDVQRLSTLIWRGPGGEIAWEGRLDSAARTSGDQMAISPAAVGWQAHLEDDKSAVVIYRDVDLSRWQGPSTQRRVNLLTANNRMAIDPTATSDTSNGLPALAMELDGPWASGMECDAFYDAGSAKVSRVYWDRISQSDQASQPGATFEFYAGTADTDTLTNSDLTSDLHTAAADSEAQAFTPTTPQRWATFIWRLAAANTTAGQYTSLLRRVAVYGQTDLTLRGTEPDAGYFASDVVAHAVERWAPLLTVTADSVRASGFIIPHLTFLDPGTTAGEIVRQATRFGLQDWAVWENRTFYWAARGVFGRKWRARIAPAQLSETGPTMDRLCNNVIVAYQDVDGSTRTVGPIGSGADTEDATLHDDDPENPANQLGISLYPSTPLQMGVSTSAGAIQVGARFLEEQKLLDTSGQAQLVGHVEDDHGVIHPAWKVRAGDQISFIDAADTSYRRIVRASYEHDSRTCSIDLDAPPEGLDALLERLGVVLTPLGVG